MNFCDLRVPNPEFVRGSEMVVLVQTYNPGETCWVLGKPLIDVIMEKIVCLDGIFSHQILNIGSWVCTHRNFLVPSMASINAGFYKSIPYHSGELTSVISQLKIEIMCSTVPLMCKGFCALTIKTSENLVIYQFTDSLNYLVEVAVGIDEVHESGALSDLLSDPEIWFIVEESVFQGLLATKNIFPNVKPQLIDVYTLLTTFCGWVVSTDSGQIACQIFGGCQLLEVNSMPPIWWSLNSDVENPIPRCRYITCSWGRYMINCFLVATCYMLPGIFSVSNHLIFSSEALFDTGVDFLFKHVLNGCLYNKRRDLFRPYVYHSPMCFFKLYDENDDIEKFLPLMDRKRSWLLMSPSEASVVNCPFIWEFMKWCYENDMNSVLFPNEDSEFDLNGINDLSMLDDDDEEDEGYYEVNASFDDRIRALRDVLLHRANFPRSCYFPTPSLICKLRLGNEPFLDIGSNGKLFTNFAKTWREFQTFDELREYFDSPGALEHVLSSSPSFVSTLLGKIPPVGIALSPSSFAFSDLMHRMFFMSFTR